jgi:hypothetical protein
VLHQRCSEMQNTVRACRNAHDAKNAIRSRFMGKISFRSKPSDTIDLLCCVIFMARFLFQRGKYSAHRTCVLIPVKTAGLDF